MGLQVLRKSLLEGARQAQGLTVVIDVFRAFTCAPILFHMGVSRLFLEPDHHKALRLKEQQQDLILLGELNEKPIPGFDLSNSPTEILERGADFFRGRTVVQRTTSGVRGVSEALRRTREVVLGSFLTARATAAYIKAQEPPPPAVTLLAMGYQARIRAPEDEACADYLQHLLTGSPYDHLEAVKTVALQETAQRFLLGKVDYLPREDPIFCLQKDLFDFVLGVENNEGMIEVRKVSP